MNAYDRTMELIAGKTPDRLPVHALFMIFAADLIGVKYSEYLQNHRILVKAQVALAEKFDLDLVSCCSDAWREAADCGTKLKWFDHQPPTSEEPLLKTPADLLKLKMPEPQGGGRMTDRFDAIQLFTAYVKGEIPILGWVEGPCAEAANLYGMEPFLTATVEQPAFVADLLDWVTRLAIRFAQTQVGAGADIVGIGDAAASLVSPAFYAKEVAPREKMIVDEIHRRGARARLHICGSLQGKMEAITTVGADIVDIDFPQSMAAARAAIAPPTCLTGNLNPATQILAGKPDQIAADFVECYRQAGAPYIVAPGCEVPPATPDDNIRAMVKAAAAALA